PPNGHYAVGVGQRRYWPLEVDVAVRMTEVHEPRTRGEGEGAVVPRIDEQRCRAVVGVDSQVMQEQLDRPSGVALAAMWREHAVAEVDLPGLEPLTVGV